VSLVSDRVKCAAISRVVALASISAGMLLAGEARPQSVVSPSPPPQQQQDRSFYLGTVVTHPEDLSGVWEAPDGHGGALGIHLILDTTVPVDATTLAGARQTWLGLQVGLYRKTGAGFQPLEENDFSDSPRGGSVRYEDGRLTLHSPGYDLDLRRVAADKWTGRFHRGDFDSVVTLERPARQASNKTWFVGTWKSSFGLDTTCLHIAQPSATAFVAWADTLRAWGSTQFSLQVAKPPYSWEHYGDLVKAEPSGNGSVSVELGAYSAICCPHRFTGTSADGGKAMKADWPAGPNQSPHKSRWTKMPGGTCIAPPD
jgi:hypothetical protein